MLETQRCTQRGNKKIIIGTVREYTPVCDRINLISFKKGFVKDRRFEKKEVATKQ